MKKDGWKFIIEAPGHRAEAWADGLTLTDAGWVKFWRRKVLVGVAKHGEWQRVYLAADQSTPTAEK